MNLRKDIDELLLQANMAEPKKMAIIIKSNFDEEEDFQLHQLLKILETRVDKMKDLLVDKAILL